MSSKRGIKTTAQEFAYREKHFHDIRVVKDRQIACTSCGIELKIKIEQIFCHPLLGILQCETCWNHFNKVNDKSNVKNTEKYCSICGNNKKLYKCANKNCDSTFCKKCIKRNVNLSLLDAEKKDWKCFICYSKPIWELRAVCATVMDSFPKKGNRRNTNKIKRCSLPSERQQLKKSKELRIILQKLCDRDDDNNSDERPLNTVRAIQTNNKDRCIKRDSSSVLQEKISEIDLTDSISESSITSESLSSREQYKQRKKRRDRGAKFMQNERDSNSPLLQKISKFDEEGKNASKKNRIYIDSDNDSTDVSSNKKTKQKHTIKPNIKTDKKVKGKINNRDRTASSDIESDQNDSTNTALNAFKSLPKDTTQKNKKKDAKSYDTKLTKKKTKKYYDLTSESEDEDIADKKQNRKRRSIKRITLLSSTDEEKCGKYDKLSKKQLSDVQEDDSDASSSKEFQKVKLQKIHRNKYSSRQLVDLKVDYTKSPIVANPLNDKSKKDIDRQSNLNRSAKEILQECKKICLNFQLYMDSIEQLYDKKNEERLILKFTEKINKLKLELEKKQKELTFYQSLSRSYRSRKNSAAKKSHKEVSDDEQSLEETSVCEERIVGENKLEISENKQRESKDISECDSEEIFSADETWSLQKMQTIRDRIDTSKTENDLNHNGTKIDDEDRTLMDKSKDNDKNNVDSQDDLVASPVLGGLKEKKISMERSIKKQLSPECIKSNDNKARLTEKDIDLMDEQRKLNTYISDNKIEIEDSPLRSNNKKMTLQNDRRDSSTNQKDIINESTDMFDISFDIVENAEENRLEAEETDVRANSDKVELSSQIECINNNKTFLQDEDKVSSKKDTPLSHNDEEEKDLSNQDKQTKMASASTSNENTHGVLEKLDISEKVNTDEIESLDDAEALAKKTLLESDSDMSDNMLINASTVKQIEDLITDNTSLIEKKSESKDDNSGISSNTSTIILSMSTKKMNGVENPDSKTKIIVVENKNGSQPDKGSSKEMNFLDEETKLEEAAKKVLLESNSDDSIILSLESESDEVSDKKTGSNSSRENVKAKQALLESSNSESSCSGIVVSEIETNVSKNSKNSKRKLKSVENVVSLRVKSKKVKLDKNYHYRNDKKLRMSCEVHLVRLSKKIFKRHSHQLLKSREYLEQKALESLVNLDKLEKRHKRNIRNHSDTSTDDDSSAKISKSSNKQKGKQTIQNEESLMDHLKKVENGGVSVSAETDSDSDKSIHRIKIGRIDATPMSNEALLSEANRLAKENLLNSSDSNVEKEVELDGDNSINNEDQSENMDEKKKKNQNKSERRTSMQDDDKKEESEKSNWRQNKILTMKFSDSDTDVEKEKWKKKREIITEESKKNNSDSDDKDKLFKVKKKTKTKRWILDSDSDIKFTDCSSDSDKSSKASNTRQKLSDSDNVGKGKEKEKRKKRKHGDSSLSGTESPFEEKKTKSKRKRIKKMASDSDSSDTEIKNSQGSAQGKSGRKNIRKVLKDKQVADDTKQAAKEEEERLKRIAERQALYNEMYEMRLAGEEKVEKLVLDFDTETKKKLVSVHEELVKRLKPHQAQGIKFMWDACFESLERIKTTSGSGCIVAHCMGLGKTLQVITLTHTLLTHEETGIKTVLVVCPLSTVLNWLNEYKMWLKDLDDINVYEMTKFKKNFERRWQLQRWQRTGGVMIIGYEMFRNLTGANKNIRKAMKEAILECLVDPGADLVICDEGHLLKNEDTALSKCMRRVKTLRRVVLTGTPLQNNLIEYHCMVQFVKPNLLGTKKEFLNRFVNPITNGQFDDSTAYDVKLMKKRAHVLHKMLEGSVQRFDYSVLTPFLPPKQEYVIFVRLTDAQIKMYRYYLDNFARRSGAGGSLFADFQALQRIWTHPIVLRLNAEKIEKANEKKGLSSDTEGSLKDFIDDDSTDVDSSSDSSSDSDVQAIDDVKEKTEPNVTKNVFKRKTRNNSGGEEEVEEEKQETPETEWWSQFVQSEHFEDIRASTKLLLLFEILKECEQIGDKLLVFSQSLYSLTLIEEFLGRIDDQTQNDTSLDTLEGHTGSWSSGLDYFRLDGQTSAENRSLWCKIFNKPTNTRARLFLISTRAGGLGINLTAANRVIIFDASWNPSHDVQSIFRIYRFGQKKPCYVYRFLAAGTMEEKIYNRQVTKLSLSCRVVDEQQIERHYSNHDLNELYMFDGCSDKERPTLNLPKDRLLAEIFLKYKDFVENYHEHDSLLENKAEEELDEEERKQAWLEYEEEKKGKPLVNPMFNAYQNNLLLQQYNMMNPGQSAGMLSQNMSAQLEYESLQQLIRKDYPNATPEQQQKMTQRALMEMYNYWEKQATLYTKQPMRNPATVQNFQQQMIMPQASNSNAQQISQLNQLLTSGQLGNYLNVNKPAQPSVTQRADLLPNPFTYRNVPSANNKGGNAEDDIIEVIPTTSNAGTSNVQAAVQSSDKSKNQEE